MSSSEFSEFKRRIDASLMVQVQQLQQALHSCRAEKQALQQQVWEQASANGLLQQERQRLTVRSMELEHQLQSRDGNISALKQEHSAVVQAQRALAEQLQQQVWEQASALRRLHQENAELRSTVEQLREQPSTEELQHQLQCRDLTISVLEQERGSAVQAQRALEEELTQQKQQSAELISHLQGELQEVREQLSTSTERLQERHEQELQSLSTKSCLHKEADKVCGRLQKENTALTSAHQRAEELVQSLQQSLQEKDALIHSLQSQTPASPEASASADLQKETEELRTALEDGARLIVHLKETVELDFQEKKALAHDLSEADRERRALEGDLKVVCGHCVQQIAAHRQREAEQAERDRLRSQRAWKPPHHRVEHQDRPLRYSVLH